MIDPLLIDLPPVLHTERLSLRPPRAGDGATLFDAVSETLPELRRFLASLPWVAREQSAESSELFCRHAQSNFLARRDLPFLIFETATGLLVGVVGLHRPVWTTPKADVGYWGRSSTGGRGFIGEAVMAMVDLAFGPLGMVRLELVTDAENAASRRVAERCGFQLEGILRQERRAPDGSLRDTCMYARLPPAAT